MKKSRIEAAETRRRIIKAASQEFSRNGIHATGLTDLMGAAGLTQGGFYKHFRSKNQVVAEAFASGMDAVVDLAETAANPAPGKTGLEAIVETYLSTDHRDNPADGCPLAGLGSELVHADDQVRTASSEGFTKLVDVIAKQFPRLEPEAARARAIFILSAMVGALTMARMVTDRNLSSSILEQARQSLLKP
jgi:TetR/AcrR family transcriptional repressor of nem operon